MFKKIVTIFYSETKKFRWHKKIVFFDHLMNMRKLFFGFIIGRSPIRYKVFYFRFCPFSISYFLLVTYEIDAYLNLPKKMVAVSPGLGHAC